MSTETNLENLREALAFGDTIDISRAMPWGMQTYQMAQAALEGYRSRDAEVEELKIRLGHAHQDIKSAGNELTENFHKIAALQAEKAELVEEIQVIINRDGMFDHERIGKFAALLAKHGKES
jgi:hypothetical protein